MAPAKEDPVVRPSLTLSLVLGSSLVLASCADNPDSEVVDSSTADTLPAGWTTYTDEIASYSISFPGQWVLLEVDDAAVAELLGALADGSDVPLEGVATVFAAGADDASSYPDPNVNIVIEPLPSDMSADDYASLAISGAEDLLESLETTSRSRVEIGGREAIVVRSSYALSEVDPTQAEETRWWTVQLAVPDSGVGWTVSCGTAGVSVDDVGEDLDTCDDVVRSFRLLSE